MLCEDRKLSEAGMTDYLTELALALMPAFGNLTGAALAELLPVSRRAQLGAGGSAEVMIRTRRLAFGLMLGASVASLTLAQGVPVSDALRTLRAGTLSVLQGRIVGEAEDGNSVRIDMNALHRDQLAAIDAAIADQLVEAN